MDPKETQPIEDRVTQLEALVSELQDAVLALEGKEDNQTEPS